MIFTFWEGPMPAYIEMCLETWQDKFPFVVLNYDNLETYTEYDIESAKRFTLPIQADAVRVHVLRDNGGYWLDADTIMLTDHLPDADILGNIWEGTNTIGYLRSNKQMFEAWAEYQDNVIEAYGREVKRVEANWDILGNAFTDPYLKTHNDVKIGSIETHWPEVYMIKDNMKRAMKYLTFYFASNYHLTDIKKTDMLMLHNSWTPAKYKARTRENVLQRNCTLSNILREVLQQ